MRPRPFDPDELPIEALMDDAPGGMPPERQPIRRAPASVELRPRPFDLKSIAGRLVGAGRPRG
jgi:hypothetical protein